MHFHYVLIVISHIPSVCIYDLFLLSPYWHIILHQKIIFYYYYFHSFSKQSDRICKDQDFECYNYTIYCTVLRSNVPFNQVECKNCSPATRSCRYLHSSPASSNKYSTYSELEISRLLNCFSVSENFSMGAKKLVTDRVHLALLAQSLFGNEPHIYCLRLLKISSLTNHKMTLLLASTISFLHHVTENSQTYKLRNLLT